MFACSRESLELYEIADSRSPLPWADGQGEGNSAEIPPSILDPNRQTSPDSSAKVVAPEGTTGPTALPRDRLQESKICMNSPYLLVAAASQIFQKATVSATSGLFILGVQRVAWSQTFQKASSDTPRRSAAAASAGPTRDARHRLVPARRT